MKFLSSIFLLFIFGCASNSPQCIITSQDIINKEKDKIVVIEPKSTLINDIVDRGTDSVSEVGYYTFFNNGNLRLYRFFATKQAYIYSEEYDQFGNIISILGSPLVYRKTRIINKDSSVISYFFSTLNRTFSESVRISINDSIRFAKKLNEDSLRSNMKNVVFGLNTTGLNNVTIHLSTEFSKKCSKDIVSLKDTLNFRPAL